jgi:hypothetical protein
MLQNSTNYEMRNLQREGSSQGLQAQQLLRNRGSSCCLKAAFTGGGKIQTAGHAQVGLARVQHALIKTLSLVQQEALVIIFTWGHDEQQCSSSSSRRRPAAQVGLVGLWLEMSNHAAEGKFVKKFRVTAAMMLLHIVT